MPANAVLDPAGRPVPREIIAGIRASASTAVTAGGEMDSAYHAASLLTQETAAWRPALNSGDSAALVRRELTVARVEDLLRNDPHAKAGLDRLLDLVVGPGLHLAPKPDARALGVTPDVARELAAQMKVEWRHFANDPRRFCDATRRLGMDGLWRALGGTWFRRGEATAVLTLNDHPGARYATSVLTIDPDRLCNPNAEGDGARRRAGVEMDGAGAPVAYWVRDAHSGDWWSGVDSVRWTRVPRETDWGRPVFVHGFEPAREGMTRGVSPFVTLLTRLRMLGKFADNELASAALNALMAAFVTSDLPSDDVRERMTQSADLNGRKSWFDFQLNHFSKFPARLGGARIPVLPPGTDIKMNASPRQTTAFPHFQTAFLQSVASSLGLSYEQLAMDWSKTNYSSARAALNEVHRTVRRMAAQFVDQIVTPIYFAVMDEAFDRGYLKPPAGAPDFMDMPGAYLRALWIGPGRGYIDPVKEAEASALRQEGLISTLELELADQGLDLEETLDQIEFEHAELERRNLSRASIVAAIQAAKTLKPDSPEAEEPPPGGKEPA